MKVYFCHNEQTKSINLDLYQSGHNMPYSNSFMSDISLELRTISNFQKENISVRDAK